MRSKSLPPLQPTTLAESRRASSRLDLALTVTLTLLSLASIWIVGFFGTQDGPAHVDSVNALLRLLVEDSEIVRGFFLQPSYRSREIARRIEAIAPPEGSVARDWAPFLTLGTRVRAIYMMGEVNSLSHVP